MCYILPILSIPYLSAMKEKSRNSAEAQRAAGAAMQSSALPKDILELRGRTGCWHVLDTSGTAIPSRLRRVLPL